jgi:hypothetical protein
VHLFVGDDPDAGTPPATLDATHPSLTDLVIDRDGSQLVTRALVEGGGSVCATELAPGETLIPLVTSSWYEPAGGAIKAGPQHVTYTGVDVGGDGALVGPGAFPSVPLVADLVPGGGSVEAGVHGYAITYVTAGGESLPGPVTSITVGFSSAPDATPTGTVAVGSGLPAPASLTYGVTFVTSAGETTIGPLGTAVATVAIGNAAAPGMAGNGPNATQGDLVPGHQYAYGVCWSTASGSSSHTEQTALVNTMNVVAQASTSGGGKASHILVDMPTGPPHAPWVHLYRVDQTAIPGNSLSDFRLVTSVSNSAPNSTIRFTDTVSSASIAGTAPPGATNTARPLGNVALTLIPKGAATAGVTGRRIYRRTGAGPLKLVTTIANNTATTFTDTVPDGSLGAAPPATSTAIAQSVQLSAISKGVSDVTARKLYRTAADVAPLKLLTTIADNTTTTYLDAAADSTLGAAPPTSDLSGLKQPEGATVAGATTLPVSGAGWARAGGGWVVIGNGQQVIRYTAISGNTLTGIPASGPGAITSTIAYNSSVTASPMLVGVPASGAGAVVYPIQKGDDLNLWIIVDDLDAQTLVAALFGTTGIIEELVQDRRLSATECRARGLAYLAERRDVQITVRYRCRDVNTRSGRLVTIDLPDAPYNLTAAFIVQSVRWHDFTPALPPLGDVEASSNRWSFEDLLRRISTKAEQAQDG